MQTDETAIRQFVATWLEATKAHDTQKVLSLITDDVVFLTAGQPPMRGKAAFAAAQAGSSGMEIDATCDIQEIIVQGDWAFIWTSLAVTVTPPSAPTIKRAGHTLTILRKEAGAWLLARDANMLAGVPD
jgi:uncharacterized protein (TIGR02246 family)